MQPGDRVLYWPPTLAGRQRVGTLRTTSGQSALVLFAGDAWPQWVPLARLLPLLEDAAGWLQPALLPGDSQH